MKQAFYANPDILTERWGSKYDYLVILVVAVIATLATLVYITLSNPISSVFLRAGSALGYVGVLSGIFFHLGRQANRTDEFGQSILNQAIARAGLITLLFVIGETMYFLVIDSGDVVTLTLFSPVLFLALVWKRMRHLARSYQ